MLNVHIIGCFEMKKLGQGSNKFLQVIPCHLSASSSVFEDVWKLEMQKGSREK